MTVLPAITRELRAQARLPFTYGLRMLGVAAVLLAGIVFTMGTGLAPNAGGQMFGWLNFTLFLAIWLMVPLIACDCISRERREGTLGLLFLTPLKARDIVLAKGFVHGLRAFSLWLAVIPALAICFVLGGLSRREVVTSVLFNFSSICLALAAGLLGSVVSKTWIRAQLAAIQLSGGFACGFIGLTGVLIGTTVAFKPSSFSYTGATMLVGPGGAMAAHYARGLNGASFYFGTRSYQSLTINSDTLPIVGFLGASDFDGCWGPMFAAMSARGIASWLETDCWLALFSFLFLLCAIELAAWRLRHVWQENPPSVRQLWIENTLYRPVIGVAFLHRWLRRKLERNPIGWLEQRSWSGRLVMWGWFAVVLSIYSTVLAHGYGFRLAFRLQNFLACTLLIGIASSAAGSFQRERETGVMELLLVSPVNEREIIAGRVRALWSQFLPAILLLLCVWTYLNYWANRWESFSDFGWEGLPYYCAAFATLPVVGLYFSLRMKRFIGAFLFTLAVGLALPLLIGGLAMSFRPEITSVVPSESQDWTWIPIVTQIVIAAFLARRLHRNLRQRNFAFSREVT